MILPVHWMQVSDAELVYSRDHRPCMSLGNGKWLLGDRQRARATDHRILAIFFLIASQLAAINIGNNGACI